MLWNLRRRAVYNFSYESPLHSLLEIRTISLGAFGKSQRCGKRRRGAAQVHSGGVNPRRACAQARCSPPSTAIIWPVVAGASTRKRTAAATDWGSI